MLWNVLAGGDQSRDKDGGESLAWRRLRTATEAPTTRVTLT